MLLTFREGFVGEPFCMGTILLRQPNVGKVVVEVAEIYFETSSRCYALHCVRLTVARIFHESPAATTDMDVLPDVLGCRPLRRTVQVRLATNILRLTGGTSILFALAALRSVPQAGSQFRGLATAIHEISGLT